MTKLSDLSETPRGDDLTENRLLAAMTAEEFGHLRPHLELVTFGLGDVIYEAEDHTEYVYFPVTCIISLMYITENGASAEMGVVGNDGMVGLFAVMGNETMPHRAVVQTPGTASRIKAPMLRKEFGRCGQFHQMLMRYTQERLLQVAQIAVCNRLHPIEQRLCRWLLLCHDRHRSNELNMTQELLAGMLGVRREGVTVAAGRLQDMGAISYARGRIRILDRDVLEAVVCECYQVLRDKTAGLRE